MWIEDQHPWPIHVAFQLQNNQYILFTGCFINYCLNVDNLPLIYLLVVICCLSKCEFFSDLICVTHYSLQFYAFCILNCSQTHRTACIFNISKYLNTNITSYRGLSLPSDINLWCWDFFFILVQQCISEKSPLDQSFRIYCHPKSSITIMLGFSKQSVTTICTYLTQIFARNMCIN